MVGFCDLLGTPYAPFSKIPSVKYLTLNYVLCTQTEQFMGSGFKKGQTNRIARILKMIKIVANY